MLALPAFSASKYIDVYQQRGMRILKEPSIVTSWKVFLPLIRASQVQCQQYKVSTSSASPIRHCHLPNFAFLYE
jgi:hypothetical protein